jgi:RNase H-fold protein (predicted Holliday junction resolvase)
LSRGIEGITREKQNMSFATDQLMVIVYKLDLIIVGGKFDFHVTSNQSNEPGGFFIRAIEKYSGVVMFVE